MRKLTLVCMALLLMAGSAYATGSLQGYNIAVGHQNTYTSDSSANAAKQDTVYLLGGPGRTDGKFQDDINPSLPDLEGWYGVDLTLSTVSKWHLDTYNNPKNFSDGATDRWYWCGEYFSDDCGTGDFGGYGNNYKEWLDWTGAALDPGQPVDVHMNFWLSYDNEPGYDFLYLRYQQAGGTFATVNTWNYYGQQINDDEYFTVDNADFTSGNVTLRFDARSDGAWSDGDCYWPTVGHSQIDNVTVEMKLASDATYTLQTFDDFNTAKVGPGSWNPAFPPSVGNFADVWQLLNDIDPCAINETPQFAFLDDGVAPHPTCTGGTTSTTYGYAVLGGFVHNPDGGCSTEVNAAINNEIWSPYLTLDPAKIGARFDFDVYRHFPLSPGLQSDGTFYVWHVRSSSDGGATWTGWADRAFVYYGGPNYLRAGNTVTDLITPGSDTVQLALGLYQWINYKFGSNATPAPYFDNVSFRIYTYEGPFFAFRELEMAQDNFPTSGAIDWTTLSNNSVRFDQADDRIGTAGPNIVPGDSLSLSLTLVRPGSHLVAPPEMHYRIKCNPVYASVTRSQTPVAGYIDGVSVGDTIFANGIPVDGRWSFDMDDDNLLYPGDVVHYYFSATDQIGTDTGTQATITLPASLDGYSLFPGETGYVQYLWPNGFVVHCLPTMKSQTEGDVPSILFWNDFANRGGENEWMGALNQLGFLEGTDYDIYYTNAPSSGVGNGLGSRASVDQITYYDTILYSSGNLGSMTITGQAYLSGTRWLDDKSDDMALLDQWLDRGRNLLITGDGVGYDMATEATGEGATFVSNWLGVNVNGYSITSSIGGQNAPYVMPTTNADFILSTGFVAYGSCPAFHNFDSVSNNGAAGVTTIAQFTAADGVTPYTDYAAMTCKHTTVTGGTSIVTYAPVGLTYWYTPYASAKADAPNSARTQVLGDILLHFGHTLGSPVVATPSAGVFMAKNYPNPFNPSTKIEWSIPRAGDLSIKIYNVKGELVRTLRNGHSDATSGVEVWNGDDNHGRDVASGIYFYEVRSGDNVKINKMALVK